MYISPHWIIRPKNPGSGKKLDYLRFLLKEVNIQENNQRARETNLTLFRIWNVDNQVVT